MSAQPSNWCEQWLRRDWPEGLLLVGGVGPDGKSFQQSFTPSATASSESWSTLNDAITQLDAYGIGNGHSTWIFDSVLLWVVRRSDGAWAAACGPRQSSEGLRSAVSARLREFAS